MLKEEVVAINGNLPDSNLDGFSASDEWLDGWKRAYAIKNAELLVKPGIFQRKQSPPG